jgi:hypothetical protein
MLADSSTHALGLVAVAASLVAVAQGAYPLTTDSNCHCYKTNATRSNYFSHHRFFDFRSLSQYVNVTRPLADFEANARAPPTSAYFRDSDFTRAWAIMSWNNTERLSLNNTTITDATLKMVMSPNNIYIERDTDAPRQPSIGPPFPGNNNNPPWPWQWGRWPGDWQPRRWPGRWQPGRWQPGHGGRWQPGRWQPGPTQWQPGPRQSQSQSGETHLTMRTVRHADFQSAAEFESLSTGYQFLSVRMLARTIGSSGAVTAMFTYRPPPTPHNISLVQEADLEIRTQDPPVYVQYTNQPSWNDTSDIPDATRNVTLPGGKRWSDWAVYRMDWTPGSTTWYVNGHLVSEIRFQAPRDPAQVMFNTWSDGGSWSGHMPVGGEAYMQIKWIDMVFNNTDPGLGPGRQGGCRNVCSIDETTKLGTPVLITGGEHPLCLCFLPLN